jgi:malate synthase
MAINALNSGAKVWLADLEDASTPTWHNVVDAQLNLLRAARGELAYSSPEGREYVLRTDAPLAVVVVRPRGWHLPEKNLVIDGEAAIGALVDFGLHFFHNAHRLLDNGGGPYYYLPKLESHLEARLWNDVFVVAQDYVGVPQGTIRATVLIETIPAAFEMDEILYELRDHAAGLNAGRWDYLFSIVKYFRDSGADFVLPDRAAVSMTAPFMRAYTELLVQTCHRRGAFAMGGMAAVIPNRREPSVTEEAFDKVRADKTREADDGFDGSWVAHPDLVPVCREVFDAVLGDRPNQVDRQRTDVSVRAEDLLDVRSAGGEVTEAGLRSNLYVAVAYVAVWLSGNGAVAIHNLMEDAATAEISRSQVWQQIRNRVTLADTGNTVTAELVQKLLAEESQTLREEVGAERFEKYYVPAQALIADICLSEAYTDFLTLPAYELLDR